MLLTRIIVPCTMVKTYCVKTVVRRQCKKNSQASSENYVIYQKKHIVQKQTYYGWKTNKTNILLVNYQVTRYVIM